MTARLYPAVSSELYHADAILEGPTLSSSVAKLLVSASPAHARAAHPKLRVTPIRESEEKFELGTVVHSLLLQGLEVAEVMDYKDWRSGPAKEARDLARAHGRIPMLGHQWDEVKAMVDAIATQLADLDMDPIPFTDGQPEQTMVWDEDGVTCRARIDWLHTNGDVCDLKSTSRYAVGWDRGPLYDHGCDIQAALYTRGLVKLTGRAPEWTWIVAETKPPYGLIPYRLTASVLAIGDAKVEMALAKWRRGISSGEWPAYPPTVVDAELPPWIESRWLEREAREEVAA